MAGRGSTVSKRVAPARAFASVRNEDESRGGGTL